jgi:PAS domain S-box-containing protein
LEESSVRLPRRHHVDIVVTVGSLVALLLLVRLSAPFGSRSPTVQLVAVLLLLVQPYTLLRLLEHLRAVSAPLRWTAIGCTGAGSLAAFFLPPPRPPAFLIGAAAYFGVVQGYSAWAFITESRRSVGVTRSRLRLAGAGATIVTALVLLEGLGRIVGTRPALPLQSVLSLGMVACYWLGLATPRRLLRSWQRGELYRMLRQTAERAPDERERHLAEDLNRAAMRGVTAVATAVLIDRNGLSVHASSEPAWAGQRVVPAEGLVGTAMGGTDPVIGSRGECEPPLRDVVTGEVVAVVPIVRSSPTWGALIVVQRRASLFIHEDLALLGALCRHAADVLEHARLLRDERERQQRTADARVRESESRLEIMLDSLTDYAIVTLDGSGRLASWNRGAEAMFGCPAAAAVGQRAAILFHDDGTAFDADLERARRGASATREVTCRRHDGRTFTGSLVVRPLRLDGHDFGGFVMATRDVTEQRRLEERLSQGQKMEAIGRLAGGVAHDFNNLLTVILGFAELNLASLQADHPLRTDITEIRKAAERAAALVRQLMAFSRRQVAEARAVQLPEVVSDLVPMLQRLLGESIQIVEDLDRGARPVLADANQLGQIVINLAANARDAMPDGGRLTLRVASVTLDGTWHGSHPQPKPGSYTMLEVTDSGSGMDAATQAHIFEPFFTTKKAGHGTGLGLATVYGLVQQMGGAIAVYSERGIGTTFKIYLPEVADAHRASDASARQAGPFGTETVLLAEDEPTVRGFVASVLERAGYRVLPSANPAEALSLAAGHGGRIDLVVADMIMADGTGPELVDRLHAAHPELPALYISGYADAALAGRSDLKLDSTTFLQKPFTAQQLLGQVRRVLDHWRPQDRAREPRQ